MKSIYSDEQLLYCRRSTRLTLKAVHGLNLPLDSGVLVGELLSLRWIPSVLANAKSLLVLTS